jgi:hypothetical protein
VLQLEAVLLLTDKPKNLPHVIQQQQTCSHISLHFLFQKLLGILILVGIFKDSCKNIYIPPPFDENAVYF